MIRFAYTILCVATICLVAVGIVMLCSTGIFAEEAKKDLYYSAKRQGMWLVLGGIAMLIVAAIDYRVWKNLSWPAYLVGLVLLVGCFVPGIAALTKDGEPINGSYRWLSGEIFGLPSLRVQPSEFAKLAVLMVLAAWFAKRMDSAKQFLGGFLIPCLILGVPIALILAETDMGTAALLGVATFALMFVAGTRWVYLGLVMIAGASGLWYLISHDPERMSRMLAFLDIEANKNGDALQAYRSMLAFGSGGLEGLGLGNGRQKMLYLPFAHTDFIFPMIGEELGLVATLGVVLSFVLIAVSGALIAACAPDPFGRLLGFGLVVLICGQAMINIGVTTAVLPTKGIPLPFVSYGGSNLLCCLMSVGILLNIARQAKSPAQEDERLLARTNKVTPRI